MAQATPDLSHGRRGVKLGASEQRGGDHLGGGGLRQVRAFSQDAVAPNEHLASVWTNGVYIVSISTSLRNNPCFYKLTVENGDLCAAARRLDHLPTAGQRKTTRRADLNRNRKYKDADRRLN